MESYDVVIIGAGPAGLQCAAVLGDSGLSVLLLERKAVIGPKVCAGGLTALAGDFALPVDAARSFDKQYLVLNNTERVVTLARPLRTIDRLALGQFQLKEILTQGTVQVRTNASAISISQNELLLHDGRSVRFKFLVGADGSSSLVRRFLNLEAGLSIGMHYVIPGNFDKMIWFFEPRLLGSGYAWIIPHKTFASAGVFFNPRRVSVNNAEAALHRCLDRYGVDHRDIKLEAAPINCRYHGIQFGRVFLTGDAAGLASATTGEGIAYALASGEEVAYRILGTNTASTRFNALLRHKRAQEKVLALIDSAPRLQTPLFHLFFALAKYLRVQKHLTG